MKQTHALAALAASLSFAPCAAALDQSTPPVAANADLEIIGAGALRYPRAALRRAVEGDCVIAVDVSASGEVLAVDVVACSSAMFAAEARRYARTLRYAPLETDADVVRDEIRLRWRGEEDGEEGSGA